MHSASRTGKIPPVGILAALLIGLLAIVLVTTVSVTGAATLPNGSIVEITTRFTTKGIGFGVSSNNSETCIEAGGYVVEVDDNLILTVNGTEVGKLDDEPKNYDLVVNPVGLLITCAERTVARVR